MLCLDRLKGEKKMVQLISKRVLFLIAAKPVKVDLGVVFGANGKDATTTFAFEKALVKRMLEKYSISNSAALLGAIVYDSDARIAIRFGDAMTLKDAKQAIDRLQRDRPGNSLGKALQVARDKLFSEQYGARRSVPKTLVVFVDKKFDDMPAEKVGRIVKDMVDAGIKIVVVALGSEVDKKQVSAIATDASTLFEPPKLEATEEITRQVTEAAKPGEIQGLVAIVRQCSAI